MKRRRLENKCTPESDDDNLSGSGLNCNPFLPDEIIIEILSRLSVDALLRVKCVCKSWCATIQERYFVNKHMWRTRSIVEYAAKIKGSDEKEYRCQCVLDGLVVERSNSSLKYRIRNPSAKQKIDLPNPHKHLLFISIFLLSNDYKLVYIHHKEGTTGAEVLTLGTDHTWRSLDIPNLKSQRRQILHRSIAQVYYVIGLGEYGIICVDMETESYTSVEIPQGVFSYWKYIRPLNWGGKLALASILGGKMLVWVLENYKNQKWANKKVVIPLDSIMKELELSNEPDNHIHFKTQGSLLWFYVNRECLLGYNIRTNTFSTDATAPPGHKIHYVYRPS